MKIAVIEDEILVSEHLSDLIHEYGFTCIWQEDNPLAVKYRIAEETPDVAFLDISFNNELKGFEIAKQLNELSIPFLFISAYSDSSILDRANLLSPVGYIVKPFLPNQIKATLATLPALIQPIQQDIIEIISGKKTHRIPLKEIYYIKADNVYSVFKMKGKEDVIRITLNKILEANPKSPLRRINKSIIVNLNSASEIAKNFIVVNGEKFLISPSYREE